VSSSVERVTLVLASLATGLLACPPLTRAETASGAVLLPWPLEDNASDVALSGGLAVLRGRGSRMIRVPKSEFFMGSSDTELVDSTLLCGREPLATTCDEQTFANELARHPVKLSGYFLDRTEVTVRDYLSCVRVGRCQMPPYEHGARRFARPDFPVSLVSWEDARDFCRFRGARLPTEAEFERAARGPNGRRFPWGDLANGHRANHGRLGLDTSDASDGFAELAPVGSFEAGRTPDGFLDLAGNVSEWVADRYATQYPDQPLTDPQGPDAASATGARVARGGSFDSPMAWLRGATRFAYLPSERRPSLGFRCARSERGTAP